MSSVDNNLIVNINNQYINIFNLYKNKQLNLDEENEKKLLNYTFDTLINNYRSNLKKYNTNFNKDVDVSFKKMDEIFEMLHGLYSEYNLENVKNACYILNKNKNDSSKQITITTTSCKRLDLFKRTINSFLECCKDLYLVKEWIVIDDNSSKEDRDEMVKLYPFINFIFKNENEKGHVKSMNMIRNIVKTNYLFNLEDDWEFFYKDIYSFLLKRIFWLYINGPDSMDNFCSSYYSPCHKYLLY